MNAWQQARLDRQESRIPARAHRDRGTIITKWERFLQMFPFLAWCQLECRTLYSSQGRGGNLLVLFYEYMHCGQFEAERVRAAKFEALWYVKRESYVHLNHSDFPTHDFLVALSSSTIIG